MCGRFQQNIFSPDPEIRQRALNAGPRQDWARQAWEEYLREHADDPRVRTMARRCLNVAPTTDAVALLGGPRGLRAGIMNWGWKRDFLPKSRLLINARGEEAANKPTWAPALRARRCLIPVTGFFEWRESDKQPYNFHFPERQVFYLGAVWEKAQDADLASFALLTTEANELVAPIHHRMALVVPEGAWEPWLHPETPFAHVRELIQPYPASAMLAHPLRKRIAKAAEIGGKVGDVVAEGVD